MNKHRNIKHYRITPCEDCSHTNGINSQPISLNDIVSITNTKKYGLTYSINGYYYPINLENETKLTMKYVVPLNKEISDSKECDCFCHILAREK